eukprot:3872378-Pyramimonas_sp.AAC.1
MSHPVGSDTSCLGLRGGLNNLRGLSPGELAGFNGRVGPSTDCSFQVLGQGVVHVVQDRRRLQI